MPHTSAPGTPRRPPRLTSLDAFRGAVIASMILVNNPGHPDHVYGQLAHVEWHGWTFTDLIAPAFLWIIGVTTTFSLSRRLQAGLSRGAILRHVLRRAALLFLIGVGLAVFPALLPTPDLTALGNLKLMGILQRIALGYCLGSAIFLWTTPRGQVAWAAVLLAGYWVLLVRVPVPGHASAALEPGLNIAQFIDQQLLGRHAEGTHTLLTLMGVTATVLFGALAGRVLLAKAPAQSRAIGLFVAGMLLLGFGLLLDRWMPINRRLWTPTFCLFTAGIAMAAFAWCYWALDVKGVRRGFGLLIAYGANPILLFVLSEAVRMLAAMKGFTDSTGSWRSVWTIGYEVLLPVAESRNASLIFALGYTLLFGLFAAFMHRRGWIVKI